MKRIKNAIAALGFVAASYLGNPGKAYADQTTVCDTHNASEVQVSQLPNLRRGDILIQLQSNQTMPEAIRQRFRNRNLSDRQIERIVAEGLRNTQRNYHIDPCTSDYIVLPRYTFNRPRNNQNSTGSNYGLSQEDRLRINQTSYRIRLTQEGVERVERDLQELEGRVNQIGEDLNEFRNEMADDSSELSNILRDRAREVVHVETTRTIRDSELRDRQKLAAQREYQRTRDRDNSVSAGYGWTSQRLNGTPYAAGQTLNVEVDGSVAADSDRQWSAFVNGLARLDFMQELNSERNLRTHDIDADLGVRRNINPWLGIEGYVHLDQNGAVIFDNAGDVDVSQYNIGPGIGARINTRNFDARLGLRYGFGQNETTMDNNDSLSRFGLDSSLSVEFDPLELRLGYTLDVTDLEAANVDRSSVDHEIRGELTYGPSAVPGLEAGLQVTETLRDSDANDSETTTIGPVLRYEW